MTIMTNKIERVFLNKEAKEKILLGKHMTEVRSLLKRIFPDGYKMSIKNDIVGNFISCLPNEIWTNKSDEAIGTVIGSAYWTGYNRCYGTKSMISIKITQLKDKQFLLITHIVEDVYENSIKKRYAVIQLISETEQKIFEIKHKIIKFSINTFLAFVAAAVLIGIITILGFSILYIFNESGISFLKSLSTGITATISLVLTIFVGTLICMVLNLINGEVKRKI